MVKRWISNLNGESYCGNKNKKEVHDLDNEQANCQIIEIIAASNDLPFNTLEEAHAAGYDNCHYCLAGSTR